MLLCELRDIIPTLTPREHDLLKRAHKIHEDPNFHTHPEQQRLMTRLMKMGLVRMYHTPDIHYEVTEKGQQVL